MKIDTWLQSTTSTLQSNNIALARLDALVLLEDATGKDRSWLLAHPEFELTSQQVGQLDSQIQKRIQHVPLAYIRGKSEFYGREFMVTPDTLQPRPETETMIDLLKKMVESKKLKVESIIDVGTGSGCIAITAKLEFPDVKVYATEINEAALTIARKNAEKLHAEVDFYDGNLLAPILSTNFQLPTTILANLPYVPNSHTINEAAMQEPHIAIFGGEDGLDFYRDMFTQIAVYKEKIIDKRLSPIYIFAESLPTQHRELESIAKSYGCKQIAEKDFIQIFQYL